MTKADDKSKEPLDKKQISIPTASFPSSGLGPGTKVDHFRIDHELGRGGAGVVYLAQDTRLGRKVAIKMMPPEIADNPQVLHRWKREARLLASLNHPNIATIHEELEETEGISYLVLEYVEGDTLRDRIAHGELTLKETVLITLQIAEAISAAHSKGVVHRDLKPANIKITPEGRVKVLDFGVAKILGGRKGAPQGTIVTQPGQVIGTPGYMSPEQSLGKDTDHRTDIWSFGCVLYEMLTGKRPFPGQDTSEVLEAMLRSEPSWEALPEEIELPLRDIIRKCLDKDPDNRYHSAGALHQDLIDYHDKLASQAFPALNARALVTYACRLRILIPAALAVAGCCAVALWLLDRSAHVKWVRSEAVPTIRKLVEEERFLEAFRLGRQAERYIPADPQLAELWPQMSRTISVVTTPANAEISYREYSDMEGDWESLGLSPIEGLRIPRGTYRWKAVKKDFEVTECVSSASRGELTLILQEPNTPTSGMAQLPAGGLNVRLAYFDYTRQSIEAPAFFIDKYEVTNAEFKEFLDQGGYQRQEYWRHGFQRDGREIPWEEVVGEFRDRTGRLGPSTWEGGTYPEGLAQHPVSGVSWYEAAAYAEFADKELPTIYHWSHSACTLWQAAHIIPFSNFGRSGPAPVGSHKGMGSTGLYDMAGNVKEWCWNAVDESQNVRYILGGAWTEEEYMFLHADWASPWDRSPTNGFRCAKYVGGRESAPQALFQPTKSSFRDYTTFTPVPDEVFETYRSMYAYDQMDLNARIDDVDDSSPYWRRERVTFDAAYGDERVIAYLFLPKGVIPPYQTIMFFPGSGAIRQNASDYIRPSWYIAHIIKSGRASMYPIYKGTYERRTDRSDDVPDATVAYRDWVIQMTKDLRRSVDYLETRNDIDIQKLAYVGVSWGGEMGPIMLAVENHLKAGVLLLGGAHGCPKLPEVDEFNFAPRVKVPVLMINGEHDAIFAVALSQKPFFESFGTPAEDKKHILYPGGHGILSTHGAQVREDVLAWLDLYLGPVE